jgi:hypothetical protein
MLCEGVQAYSRPEVRSEIGILLLRRMRFRVGSSDVCGTGSRGFRQVPLPRAASGTEHDVAKDGARADVQSGRWNGLCWTHAVVLCVLFATYGNPWAFFSEVAHNVEGNLFRLWFIRNFWGVASAGDRHTLLRIS